MTFNIIWKIISEIKEESGIEVTVSTLFGVYSNTATYKGYDGITNIPTKVILDFNCKLVGGELTTSDETSACEWVDKHKVLNYISAPAIRIRFQAYQDYKGSPAYMEYVTKPS